MDSSTKSGITPGCLTTSSRYLPVLTRIPFIPTRWAPPISVKILSPIIADSSRFTPNSHKTSSKKLGAGLPINSVSLSVAYSRAATNGPADKTKLLESAQYLSISKARISASFSISLNAQVIFSKENFSSISHYHKVNICPCDSDSCILKIFVDITHGQQKASSLPSSFHFVEGSYRWSEDMVYWHIKSQVLKPLGNCLSASASGVGDKPITISMIVQEI